MRSNLRAHVHLVFASFVLMALGVGGCAQPPTTVCEAPNDVCVCDYNGKSYPVGAQFPHEDGCNTCTCGENGSVGCTKIGCPSKTCGGLLGAKCPDGQYCDFPKDALCGAADATGVCKTASENCEDIFKQVCACGDETFDNACLAAKAGKSVAYDGPCDGAVCGGFRGTQCSEKQFCSFTEDAICGFADATGTCEPRPDVCPDLVDKVCGCDGKTYNNGCEAQMAGTSVNHKKVCP